MTKEKWLDVLEEFNDESVKKHDKAGELSPDTWAEHRSIALDLIKSVDKATEVYNMENTKKGEK